MNVDTGPELLTVAETAKRLGVHENTVRNWARGGKLRSARIPGARANRFDARDVARLVSQRGKVVSTVSQGRRTIGPELVDASQLGAEETARRERYHLVAEDSPN
jgi:excisionase family DNA binding protein